MTRMWETGFSFSAWRPPDLRNVFKGRSDIFQLSGRLRLLRNSLGQNGGAGPSIIQFPSHGSIGGVEPSGKVTRFLNASDGHFGLVVRRGHDAPSAIEPAPE